MLAHVGDVLLILGAGGHLAPMGNLHADLAHQRIDAGGRRPNIEAVRWVGTALGMAETEDRLDISRQALFQADRAALLRSVVEHILGADEFAQQPRGSVDRVAGLDSGLSSALVDDRSWVVKGGVGAGKIGL